MAATVGRLAGLWWRRCVGEDVKGANEFELLKLGFRMTASVSGRRCKLLLEDDVGGGAFEEWWAGGGDGGGDGDGGEDASCALAAEGRPGERHVTTCR